MSRRDYEDRGEAVSADAAQKNQDPWGARSRVVSTINLATFGPASPEQLIADRSTVVNIPQNLMFLAR